MAFPLPYSMFFPGWLVLCGAGSPERLGDRALELHKGPGPSGDRGSMRLMMPWGRWRVCRLLYDVHQMMSIWSLYTCGPRSSRPQPMESSARSAKSQGRNGDCIFNLPPQVLLQSGFYVSLRKVQQGYVGYHFKPRSGTAPGGALSREWVTAQPAAPEAVTWACPNGG